MRLQLKGKAGGKQNSQSFINKNKLRKVSRADVLLFFSKSYSHCLSCYCTVSLSIMRFWEEKEKTDAT